MQSFESHNNYFEIKQYKNASSYVPATVTLTLTLVHEKLANQMQRGIDQWDLVFWELLDVGAHAGCCRQGLLTLGGRVLGETPGPAI